jgi:tetratricopeptide (TPR) repeat protein
MLLTPSDRALQTHVLWAIWLGSTLLLGAHAGADVGAFDSGEIGGAAIALGVAHPTGFAVDMLLLRAAALLPLGPLALRENLAVACIAAAAATLLARLTMQLCAQLGVRLVASAVGALIAASGLIAFPTFLGSALAVEVYSSSLALLLLAALVIDVERWRPSLWLLWGLCCGAHVSAGLLILPLCAATLIRDWPGFREARAPARSALGIRALLFASGALVIAYLPLASRRDTAFDWGDPQNLLGLLRHLSAARVREAYAAKMFAGASAARLVLFEQLGFAPWLLVAAAVGLVATWQKQCRAALVCLSVLTLDLAYAVWVNPMGIRQRQLGHASGAVLALFGGIGIAWLVERALLRAPRLGALAALGGTWLALEALWWAPWPPASDGYVEAERFGAGSTATELAPRAIYLCSSDSACAGALFAMYIEGARPDLAVLPAQHLWDRGVLRRLSGVPRLAGLVDASTEQTIAEGRAGPELRRMLAERVAAGLAHTNGERPVYFEDANVAARSPGLGLSKVPWFALDSAGLRDANAAEPAADGGEDDLDAEPRDPTGRVVANEASLRLIALERARFDEAGPTTPLARDLWASAHAELGKVLLRAGLTEDALWELKRTAALTPERALAHSNLGVCLEQAGDVRAALEETKLALRLDPTEPTPWVNLARLVFTRNGPVAAREVLTEARRQAVEDPRLEALRRAIDPVRR